MNSPKDLVSLSSLVLGHSSPDARFRPRTGKRISAELSIRHARTRTGLSRGDHLALTIRGHVPTLLSVDDAKRLHQWLEGVLP